jgi:diguanylate cyclase (GGDEF)-like protein
MGVRGVHRAGMRRGEYMSTPNFRFNSGPLFESAAAQQLREGFRWLRFRGALESGFRDSLRDQTRWSIFAHLCLGLALVVSFILVDYWLFDRPLTGRLLLIRLGALAPLLACIVVVGKAKLYQHIYPTIVQIMAPIFGISVVANELVDQPFDISFFPAVVLSVVSIYLLVGLTFYAALRSGFVILVVYLLAARWVDASSIETIYNGLILLFTNVIGATASYTLERLHRTNFLEACLLTDAANRDGLTGIHNRRALDDHLERLWQQATRERSPVALLLIDIDHFKLYNDYYGHQAGDESLKQVAKLLARCVRRPLDFAARYGGEEFAVVLYNARRDYVEALARNIQLGLTELGIKHQVSPITKQLTISIGAACIIPDPDRSHFGFIQLADEALYDAKENGRDRVVIREAEYGDLATGSFRNRGQLRSAGNL